MIYRSLADIPADFGPCAITIGNFDGVHRRPPRNSTASGRYRSEEGLESRRPDLRSSSDANSLRPPKRRTCSPLPNNARG